MYADERNRTRGTRHLAGLRPPDHDVHSLDDSVESLARRFDVIERHVSAGGIDHLHRESGMQSNWRLNDVEPPPARD